jgi:hypothetical protein
MNADEIDALRSKIEILWRMTNDNETANELEEISSELHAAWVRAQEKEVSAILSGAT